MFNKDVEIA